MTGRLGRYCAYISAVIGLCLTFLLVRRGAGDGPGGPSYARVARRWIRKGSSSRTVIAFMACVDIWVVVFVLHRGAAQVPDVSLAISKAGEPAGFAQREPLQVWVTERGLGLWPRTDQPLSLEEVEKYLDKQTENSRRVELRLLVDPELSLRQWGRIALELSRHAEDIRVAPLPRAADAR